MTKKLLIFALFLSFLIIIGSSSPVWAAQLDARINPDSPTSNIQIKYQRTVMIEYEEGGEIANLLRGQSWKTEVIADSSNPAVQDLINRINQKISSDGSGARISNLNVEYTAMLGGRGLNAAIDYKLILSGDLTDYTIRARQGQAPALIDLGWRGITVQGPVVIDGVEINIPVSVIKENSPSLYSEISGSEAEALLSEVLINAEGIKDQPLTNWHFLFDPTGIGVDAASFGLAEEISGFVVSSYTMGESSIREGRQVEKISEAHFTADRDYLVRDIQSADNANLAIIGFGAIDKLEGIEIVGVTPTPPEGFTTTATGEFPVVIMYAMAGMAAVAGGVIFFISNRKLKAEAGKQGQTGIDPKLLRSYQTSEAAGGYQTVRGEAQLIDDTDYQRTRSVYDEQQPAEKSSESQSQRGALPKGWKKK